MDEIKEVEEQFDNGQQKKKPPMPCSHPKHGGMAIWTQGLIVRIDKAKNVRIFEIILGKKAYLSDL